MWPLPESQGSQTRTFDTLPSVARPSGTRSFFRRELTGEPALDSPAVFNAKGRFCARRIRAFDEVAGVGHACSRSACVVGWPRGPQKAMARATCRQGVAVQML